MKNIIERECSIMMETPDVDRFVTLQREERERQLSESHSMGFW